MAGSMVFGLSSCRDDWSGENTGPNQLATVTPNQLIATAEMVVYPYGYGCWWFNQPSYASLAQMIGWTGGIVEGRVLASPGVTDDLGNIQKIDAAMEDCLSKMSEEEAASYANYRHVTKVLTIFNAILASDTRADIPYTEGGRGFFGGTLRPKYDAVAELYPLWDSELKAAVQGFKNPPTGGIYMPEQDIAYGLDWSKWAKLASSLRVKLATRLIHRDLEKAKSIVSEAVADGVITESSDNLYYYKSDSRAVGQVGGIDAGDLAFGSGNNTIDQAGQSANEKVVDFLLKNRDPRLRMQFLKSNWNASVLNYWLQNGYKDIVPPAVLERAEIAPDGANFKFVKWKDEFGGNLWARYIGLPDDYNAVNSKDLRLTQFYQYSQKPANGGHAITVEVNGNDAEFSYRPYSRMIQKLIQTNQDYTAPRLPGVNAAKADLETDVPRHDLYIGAAEVNFYLAEFAVYGTPGLGSASQYFAKAVEQSVKEWDQLAKDNDIPYYASTYGVSDDDVSVALRDGEIAALLAKPDYKLTGNKADDLEKIFLNMEIHFMYSPVDQYVTCRRSGIPKFGSNLIARTDYAASAAIPANVIPRRPNFGIPSDTDPMRDILNDLYTRNGWTLNIQDARNGVLNTERLWQDVGAPQYGAGPNVGI